MRSFSKDEMEVLDTEAEPGDLRGFLLDIADYVLENDVTLHDGETIGFGDGSGWPSPAALGCGIRV